MCSLRRWQTPHRDDRSPLTVGALVMPANSISERKLSKPQQTSSQSVLQRSVGPAPGHCRKIKLVADSNGLPVLDRPVKSSTVGTGIRAICYRERAALIGFEGDLLCQHDVPRGEIAIRPEAPFAN